MRKPGKAKGTVAYSLLVVGDGSLTKKKGSVTDFLLVIG